MGLSGVWGQDLTGTALAQEGHCQDQLEAQPPILAAYLPRWGDSSPPEDALKPWEGSRGDGPWSPTPWPVVMALSNDKVSAAALWLEVETENPICAARWPAGRTRGGDSACGGVTGCGSLPFSRRESL